MNLIQTALLALPAAVTGFLGALSFSSDSGSELKIAALAGQTEFPEFTGEQIFDQWKAEMATRRSEKTKHKQRQEIEQKMKENRPDFQLLNEDIKQLRIDASTQKAVNQLNTLNWNDNVQALVKEIKEFPDELEREKKALEEKLASLEPAKQKPEIGALNTRIIKALDNLKNKQPEWRDKLKNYLMDYKNIPSPTLEK